MTPKDETTIDTATERIARDLKAGELIAWARARAQRGEDTGFGNVFNGLPHVLVYDRAEMRGIYNELVAAGQWPTPANGACPRCGHKRIEYVCRCGYRF